MRELDEVELACLKKMANQSPDTAVACSADTLKHLESMGLIERVPGLWLPLEMMHLHWRLTTAGRAAIGA